MNSKAFNKSPKTNQFNQNTLPSKSRSKEKPSQPNNKDTKLISIGEKEIDALSLAANNSQISDLNILSKNNDMARIKTYEIKIYEKVTFLLRFEIVKEKMNISVIEKNSFPQNKCENYYTLEDFIEINKWFDIFNKIEILLYELELLTKNEYFTIEQKDKNVLSLFIVFQNDLLDKIEISLTAKEINNLDLFSQLITKITEIESKENNENAFFNEKIDNLEHLLQNPEETNKARKEEILQNKQNENKNDRSYNLEEIKDVPKLKIEKKIKNDNDIKNTNEVTKEEKRREEKRREEKRREEKRREKFIKGDALHL